MNLIPANAFWWKGTGGNGHPEGSHLFVCLAAAPSTGEYLLVPICSQTPQSDKTCLLSGADHPDLNRPSYVAYYRMRIASQKIIDGADFGNRIRRTSDFSPSLFGRACTGVAASNESPPKAQAFFTANKPP